ncbi:MAG: HEAT repeat domain-containing protein [Spirochaetes bacterium]|nr:HEAT repeat domain-containing protein [Spirochaetota bacterium]
MDTILSFFASLDPSLRYAVFGLAGVGAVVWVVCYVVLHGRLLRRLKKAFEEQLSLTPEVPAKKLCRKARLISKLLKQTDETNRTELLGKTGIAGAWASSLEHSCKSAAFKRVLDQYLAEGLFYCFKCALKRKRYKKRLLSWISHNETRLPIQDIAHSGNGEDFDGGQAAVLLASHSEEIRSMLGDPSWRGRFFAMKVLLQTADENILRELSDLFFDTSPVIRKKMIEEFKPLSEREKEALSRIILNDPNDEVRAQAVSRYRKEYGSLFETDTQKLNPEETLHLIGALRTGNRDDEALATELVLSENLEVRFHAARYLSRSGALSRYCRNLDIGDKKDFAHKSRIMKAAASVGVTRFLKDCIGDDTRESLLVAATILAESGDRALIPDLMKKASESEWGDVYGQSVRAAVKRGTLQAKALLCVELKKRLDDRELLVDLIQQVTALDDAMFIDPLIHILDRRGDVTDITCKALLTKNSDVLTERCIDVLLSDDGTHSVRLKTQSLILLASLKKEYCLSVVFEHLPVLPVELMNELADILRMYPKTVLKKKMGYYLAQADGDVRSHIIALIPKTGIKDFLPEVKRALNDADPLVRIAATYALAEMEDSRSLSQAVSLLRDPLPEVREQVAFALGRTGKPGVLKEFERIFNDKNEVVSVKRSIIRGLGESMCVACTGLLLDFLEKDGHLSDEIVELLKTHIPKANITVILERMKDASDKQKEKISRVLSRMGLSAKPALVELLESEFMSLKTHAGMVLDSVGGTDEEIIKLKHRDPAVRREAARTLSLIGTVKAFRGLIMASRDPDREVRVNVVKALEKLETKEGKQILKTLEQDPDLKIRKYTHWAMERLKAKELV